MTGTLLVVEHVHGQLTDISRELIGAAVSIGAAGGEVAACVIGDRPEAFLDDLNLLGVDEVIAVSSGSSEFDAATYEAALRQLILERRPRLVLAGHTANGMGFAPALAARIGAGFASDVCAIAVEGGSIVVTRGSYANRVNVELEFPGKPVVVLMLRAATFKAPKEAGQARLTSIAFDAGGLAHRSEHMAYIEAPAAGVDISKTEFILSIGRGIQDEKNVPRFAALAERLGATLGCSRPVADAGWLHKAHQVGLTGKVAANCKLYIALGISGAVQHLHGMKHVETIIAINTDVSAPIYGVATYGAAVDVLEFADALERQFN